MQHQPSTRRTQTRSSHRCRRPSNITEQLRTRIGNHVTLHEKKKDNLRKPFERIIQKRERRSSYRPTRWAAVSTATPRCQTEPGQEPQDIILLVKASRSDQKAVSWAHVLPHHGTFFTSKATEDTPLLVIALRPKPTVGLLDAPGLQRPSRGEGAEATGSRALLERLSLWEEVRKRLPYYRTELLCVKVSGDLCMIAGRHPTFEGTVADLMRLAVWLSSTFSGVAQQRCDVCVRAALVYGPMRGAVLGSSALSYELYGEAASTVSLVI